MKLKICITVFVSLLTLFSPNNLFSCGGEIDPYDYYSSFFNQYAAGNNQLKPFLYTNMEFLYDEEEPVSPATILAKEWSDFTGGKAAPDAAYDFVMRFNNKDLTNLYYHLEKNKPLQLPDSVAKNSMTQFFIAGKDLEALGYIMYAKKVEPYVNTIYDAWSTTPKDSLALSRLMKSGTQLYNAAKTDLFKLKYAYQVMRLALYNNMYEAAAAYYDEWIATNSTQSILQPLSLSLKAGALYRMGKKEEAAYLFSKTFFASPAKKVSNYLGFNWAIKREDKIDRYLTYCKNNTEKANMMGLYMLGNPATDLTTLQTIYTLNPASAVFETLLVREVNKYEELYLAPMLAANKGDKDFYYYFREGKPDSIVRAEQPHLKQFTTFLETIAGQSGNPHQALAQVAAAYCAYLLTDYTRANEWLGKAKKLKLTRVLEDQWMLTNLLVTINTATQMDAAAEAKILPSIQWLAKKAFANKTTEWAGNSETSQWPKFYRNVMADILAPKYNKQGDYIKELLCRSNADSIGGSYYSSAVDYMRTKFDSKQVEQLYKFLDGASFTPYETFIVKNGVVNKTQVIDFAGTAYLRDYNYDKALEWFSKNAENGVIEKNPFADLLYDREERLPGDKVTTTKKQYAITMKKLLSEVALGNNTPQALYKLGLGYYNVTYYGYAWELVHYYRSGTDGYALPDKATAFEKDYYGCYRAETYFRKAMEATADAELKARCLFMIAKCTQKQLQKPEPYRFANYDEGEKALAIYDQKFMNNTNFPLLVQQYGNTKFYKEALSRCSYLRDFAAKK